LEIQWVRLADLKESNPVELAEYAIGNKLVNEPAFKWWVPFTIKKRDRIIAKIKTRYLRKEQKFGIDLPKTVNDALRLDQENNNTLWQDAIKKEMNVILPAVKILDEGAASPIGYQQIPCHIVFDIKIDFTRKARFVAGGHVTNPPSTQTYASVVSRESVRIALLIASLNDMEVMTADVQGAYLNAPCHERVYTICGREFGVENTGRIAVIVKALYGLKTSAYAWREHLSQTLRELGFRACIADNDVWMRPVESKSRGKLYEYILVYTNDLLCVSLQPQEILNSLDQHYLLKPESIGVPKTYLGADITEYRLPDRPEKPRWAMSSSKYVTEAIRNVKQWLDNRGKYLKTRASSVLPSGYRPELDTSPYCNDDDANYYQQQIGVLRWAVELGRIDILTEVSMLAS
jgi:Reverse transcriptase (RNA-dependent DNA polymerase)